MMKKVHIYTNYDNTVVINNYLSIIKTALLNMGFLCDEVTDLHGLNKKDLYIFPLGKDAFQYYLMGYKNFFLWQQGTTADESYMRNKSKLRYWLLNYMDCFAMKKAKLIFFCSERMKKHYEMLAKRSFDNKSYVMPCYNEELCVNSIKNKDYSKKNFAYVGSLSVWQCFDEIACLYKKIEDVYPDSFFKVLTFSVEDATNKIQALGIKNYEVKNVAKEAVQKELADTVYGFIIRKDSIVNAVATPTKISSYMSVGIIPIFSAVLDDFYRVSKNMKYVIPVKQNDNSEIILSRISQAIDKDELTEEYEALFKTYYGTACHVKNIQKIATKMLNRR